MVDALVATSWTAMVVVRKVSAAISSWFSSFWLPKDGVGSRERHLITDLSLGISEDGTGIPWDTA